MLLFVFPLSYSNVPSKPSYDNSLDESSVTASYEIPVIPCRPNDTAQFTCKQSLDHLYEYVDVRL